MTVEGETNLLGRSDSRLSEDHIGIGELESAFYPYLVMEYKDNSTESGARSCRQGNTESFGFHEPVSVLSGCSYKHYSLA